MNLETLFPAGILYNLNGMLRNRFEMNEVIYIALGLKLAFRV